MRKTKTSSPVNGEEVLLLRPAHPFPKCDMKNLIDKVMFLVIFGEGAVSAAMGVGFFGYTRQNHGETHPHPHQFGTLSGLSNLLGLEDLQAARHRATGPG
jgi:hypothetical protein